MKERGVVNIMMSHKELLDSFCVVTNHDMAVSQSFLSDPYTTGVLENFKGNVSPCVSDVIQRVVSFYDNNPEKNKKVELNIDEAFFHLSNDINQPIDLVKVRNIQKALMRLEIMKEWLNKTNCDEKIKKAFNHLDFSLLNSKLSKFNNIDKKDLRYQIRNDIAISEKIFPIKKKMWRRVFLKNVSDKLKNEKEMVEAINGRQSIRKKNQKGNFEKYDIKDLDELNHVLNELDELDFKLKGEEAEKQKEKANYFIDYERIKSFIKNIGFSDSEIETMKISDMLKYEAAAWVAYGEITQNISAAMIKPFTEEAYDKQLDLVKDNSIDFQSHLFALTKSIVQDHMDGKTLLDDIRKHKSFSSALLEFEAEKSGDEFKNTLSALQGPLIREKIKSHYTFCKNSYENQNISDEIDGMRDNLLLNLTDGKLGKAFVIIQYQKHHALNKEIFGGKDNVLYSGINAIENEFKEAYPTHYQQYNKLYAFIHENLITTKEKVKEKVKLKGLGFFKSHDELEIRKLEARILDVFDRDKRITDVKDEIDKIIKDPNFSQNKDIKKKLANIKNKLPSLKMSESQVQLRYQRSGK